MDMDMDMEAHMGEPEEWHNAMDDFAIAPSANAAPATSDPGTAMGAADATTDNSAPAVDMATARDAAASALVPTVDADLSTSDKQGKEERALRSRAAAQKHSLPSADVAAAKRTRRAHDSADGNTAAETQQQEPAGDEEALAPAPARQSGGKEGRKGGSKKAQEMSIDQVEMETAFLVGLNENQVEEEEAAMLPAGTNQSAYVKVRNHVLARWRIDVSRYLGLAEAGASIQARYHPLVELAWTYLNTQGFINFGVAPALLRDPTMDGEDKPSVIVVGAGLAGAAAARQLSKWGYRVVVLEGRNRPGGRVWSMPLEGHGHAGAADLGGAIITGIDGNPLAVLAKQMGLPMHNIRDTCPMYLEGGGLAPKELDEQVHAQHNALLDAAHEFREELPAEVADVCSMGSAMRMLWEEVARESGQEDLQERLMRWHFSNVEFANAARISTLSLRGWDQDDPYEMLGAHVLLPGGNVRLVEGLLQGVPVMYDAAVQEVLHTSTGVTVTTADATLTADAVLVTVPLGVLKRQAIAFDPPLPRAKQDAIQRLGFGVLNKLVLLFPHAFWEPHLDLLAHVAADPQDSGLFFLFYAFHERLAGKGAVLGALVSGESAERFEKLPVRDAVERVMRVLKTMHEPQGTQVPEPLQAVATRWAGDPLSCGSYSSVAVGATGDDYVTMAQDIGGRVFFGGEATIVKWPATMHGAFLSGLREAGKIKLTFEGPRKRKRGAAEIPASAELVPEDGKPEEVHITANNQKGAKGGKAWESEEDSEIEMYELEDEEEEEEEVEEEDGSDSDVWMGGRGAREDAGRAAGGAASTARAADLEAMVQLVQSGVALNRLFNEEEPDIEFGCFTGFTGPPDTPWQDNALMQIDLRAIRNGPKKSMALYCVLTHEQLSEIRSITDDQVRVATLVGSMGVALVGRPVEGSPCNSLLRALLKARELEGFLDPSQAPKHQEDSPAPPDDHQPIPAPENVQTVSTLVTATNFNHQHNEQRAQQQGPGITHGNTGVQPAGRERKISAGRRQVDAKSPQETSSPGAIVKEKASPQRHGRASLQQPVETIEIDDDSDDEPSPIILGSSPAGKVHATAAATPALLRLLAHQQRMDQMKNAAGGSQPAQPASATQPRDIPSTSDAQMPHAAPVHLAAQTALSSQAPAAAAAAAAAPAPLEAKMPVPEGTFTRPQPLPGPQRPPVPVGSAALQPATQSNATVVRPPVPASKATPATTPARSKPLPAGTGQLMPTSSGPAQQLSGSRLQPLQQATGSVSGGRQQSSLAASGNSNAAAPVRSVGSGPATSRGNGTAGEAGVVNASNRGSPHAANGVGVFVAGNADKSAPIRSASVGSSARGRTGSVAAGSGGPGTGATTGAASAGAGPGTGSTGAIGRAVPTDSGSSGRVGSEPTSSHGAGGRASSLSIQSLKAMIAAIPPPR